MVTSNEHLLKSEYSQHDFFFFFRAWLYCHYVMPVAENINSFSNEGCSSALNFLTKLIVCWSSILLFRNINSKTYKAKFLR
ncbi:hypothetical protein CW304_02895 [Bacillus sp. UFRGS-B20]|nr:hypothetical protein CW304_02895 [Bacillus sp. UFRGS-B20]